MRTVVIRAIHVPEQSTLPWSQIRTKTKVSCETGSHNPVEKNSLNPRSVGNPDREGLGRMLLA